MLTLLNIAKTASRRLLDRLFAQSVSQAAISCFLLTGIVLTHSASADPQRSPNPILANPMADFADYIGGPWVSGPTEQIYEWGPDRNSVFAKSFVTAGDQRTPSASGLWYFDPSSKEIKGVFVARNMPFVVLHYTTRFEDKAMISNVTSIDRQGQSRRYVERQSPGTHGVYDWTLIDPQSPGTPLSAQFHLKP